MREFFRDRDAGDTLTYSIAGNTNPDLFDSVVVDAGTGDLSIRYAQFVSGTARITVRVTDATGRSADQEVTVTLPEIDPPDFTVRQDLRLNRQTGLWEQAVTVANIARRDIGAFRLLIGGLEEGVSVHNASDRLPDGRAEVLYNRILPAGESVEVVVEYYSADRTPEVMPTLEVEISMRRTVEKNPGSGFAIDRMVLLRDGSVLIEFPSEPGALYMAQSSSRHAELGGRVRPASGRRPRAYSGSTAVAMRVRARCRDARRPATTASCGSSRRLVRLQLPRGAGRARRELAGA